MKTWITVGSLLTILATCPAFGQGTSAGTPIVIAGSAESVNPPGTGHGQGDESHRHDAGCHHEA
jgi:hypothetical protein